MTEPTLHRVRANGIELAYFEWNAERAGRDPTLLLAHATGFHARVWDPMISHLGERHVIAVDQRGHGRSEKAAVDSWETVGEDLRQLVSGLSLRGAVGVGHSMGGHAITEAAAALPGAFARLVLVDPVIASPGEYAGGGWSGEALPDQQHPTARRKNRFTSPDEMFERFRDRHPYSLFEPAALRAYCEHGLLPAPDGDGYVLACPPEIEARIYMTSRTNPGVYRAIRSLEIPVLVLRARGSEKRKGIMDFTTSPTWPGLAGEFRYGRDLQIPELTHFMPMQEPARIAELVLGSGR